MAIDPVSAGLGAATLITGKDANRKAKNDAKRANAMQMQLWERALKFYDMMSAEGQAAAGALNPEAQIENMKKHVSDWEGTDQANLQSALRIGGYNSKDSEAVLRTGAVHSRWKNHLADRILDVSRQSIFDKLAALSAGNPGSLGLPMQIAQNQMQQAQSQMQNPAGFINSIMPFLSNQNHSDSPRDYGFEDITDGSFGNTGNSALDKYLKYKAGGR